jgi:hypothetical protein
MPRSATGKAKPVPPPEAPPMSEEPVDGAALLQAIADTFGRYMWMQEQHRITCALWVLHTYAAEASFFTPYLHVYSPVRECGKSTLLTILEALARRPALDPRAPVAVAKLLMARAERARCSSQGAARGLYGVRKSLDEAWASTGVVAAAERAWRRLLGDTGA